MSVDYSKKRSEMSVEFAEKKVRNECRKYAE